MAFEPLKVACIGMGWWSDVLADAMVRSGKLNIAACYTRSEPKREAFATKYGCRAGPSNEGILEDGKIQAIVNTTPQGGRGAGPWLSAAQGNPFPLDTPPDRRRGIRQDRQCRSQYQPRPAGQV